MKSFNRRRVRLGEPGPRLSLLVGIVVVWSPGWSSELPREPPFVVDEVIEKVLPHTVTDWRISRAPAVSPRGHIVFAGFDASQMKHGLFQAIGSIALPLRYSKDSAPGFPAGYIVEFNHEIQYSIAEDNSVVVIAPYVLPPLPGEFIPRDSGMVLYRIRLLVLQRRVTDTGSSALLRGGTAPTFLQQPLAETDKDDHQDLTCFIAVYHDFNQRTTHDRIYLIKGDDPPRLVVQTGEVLPGASPPESLHSDVFVAYSADRHRTFLSKAGDVAFVSNVRAGGLYVWRYATGQIEKVVATGDRVPGQAATVQQAYGFQMNSHGVFTFATMNSDFRQAIWRVAADGTRSLIARDSQDIEVSGGGRADDVFVLGPPAINDRGHIAFPANPSGGDFTRQLLLVWEEGVYRVALQAGPVPDFPDLEVRSMEQIQLNAEGDLLFTDEVGGFNLWAAARGGAPRLLARQFPSDFRIGRDGDGQPIVRRLEGVQAMLGDGGLVALGVDYRDAEFPTGLFVLSLSPKPLVVNSTNDDPDRSPGDGVCDTGWIVKDLEGEVASECTLRAAIQEANARPDRTEIHFGIAGEAPHRIMPVHSLPAVVHPVEIDAGTQPGYSLHPVVELHGGRIQVDDSSGLVIEAGESLVRGLAIIRFIAHGILLRGPGKNRVEACHIGSNRSFEPRLGNLRTGIRIEHSPENVIGGTPEKRNTIVANGLSGTVGCGVEVVGGLSTGNRILGNEIGWPDAGGERLGNRSGVCLEDATETLVEGNVFCNNLERGVVVRGLGGEASNNSIRGNRIVQEPDDLAPLRLQHGIEVADAVETEIEDNVISNQKGHGVSVWTQNRDLFVLATVDGRYRLPADEVRRRLSGAFPRPPGAWIGGHRIPRAEALEAYAGGRMREAAGQLAAAAEEFARAAVREPYRAEPALALADCRLAMAQGGEAEAVLRSALERGAEPADALWRAWSRLVAGGPDRTLQDFLAALPRPPAGGEPGEPRTELARDVHGAMAELAARGALRINCGGEACRDGEGRAWGPDRFHRFGSAVSLAGAGRQEAREPWERDGRSFPGSHAGCAGYTLVLPRGIYGVKLHLAAPPSGRAAGIWSVRSRGRIVLQESRGLEAGGSLTREVEVAVEDGTLDLGLEAFGGDPPVLAALEVRSHDFRGGSR